MQFSGLWFCAIYRGVLHTPYTPPHEPHRKPPPQHCMIGAIQGVCNTPIQQYNSSNNTTLRIHAAHNPHCGSKYAALLQQQAAVGLDYNLCLTLGVDFQFLHLPLRKRITLGGAVVVISYLLAGKHGQVER